MRSESCFQTLVVIKWLMLKIDLYHNVLDYQNTDCIMGTESQTFTFAMYVFQRRVIVPNHAQMVSMTAPFINRILQLKTSVINESQIHQYSPSPLFWKCLTRNTVFTVSVHAQGAGLKEKLSNTFTWDHQAGKSLFHHSFNSLKAEKPAQEFFKLLTHQRKTHENISFSIRDDEAHTSLTIFASYIFRWKKNNLILPKKNYPQDHLFSGECTLIGIPVNVLVWAWG